jgi:hypothetical protein
LRQFLDDIGRADCGQNFARGGASVQRIKMQPRDARLQQLYALRCCVGDAKLQHRFRAVSLVVQLSGQAVGQGSAARYREAFHLARVGNRHDSRDDGHRYAFGAGIFHELEVAPVVEEQLRDDETRSCIHLALQIGKIDGRITAFDVFFGVTGAAHTQLVAMQLTDEIDQLVCVPETPFDSGEGGLALGRIPAQGEHVFDIRFDQALENGFQLVLGGPDARQMGHTLDARVALDPSDDVDGFFARGTARAIGNGYKIRSQRSKFRNSFLEHARGFVALRREELEGKNGPAPAQDVSDEHSFQFARSAAILSGSFGTTMGWFPKCGSIVDPSGAVRAPV